MDCQTETTYKHWLMLRYWHHVATDEDKMLCRLPEAGYSLQSLINRGLDKIDLEHIESCYEELRAHVKECLLH